MQILGRPELPDETRQEFTNLDSREVVRLKNMLADFLDFARPQPPHFMASEISLILDSVAMLAAGTATVAKVVCCRSVACCLVAVEETLRTFRHNRVQQVSSRQRQICCIAPVTQTERGPR